MYRSTTMMSVLPIQIRVGYPRKFIGKQGMTLNMYITWIHLGWLAQCYSWPVGIIGNEVTMSQATEKPLPANNKGYVGVTNRMWRVPPIRNFCAECIGGHRQESQMVDNIYTEQKKTYLTNLQWWNTCYCSCIPKTSHCQHSPVFLYRSILSYPTNK